VVRRVAGARLEKGESQGLPVWSPHVGGSIVESNKTRRIDFALFISRRSRTTPLSMKRRRSSGSQTRSAIAQAAHG
jgi:hypothetical protein